MGQVVASTTAQQSLDKSGEGGQESGAGCSGAAAATAGGLQGEKVWDMVRGKHRLRPLASDEVARVSERLEQLEQKLADQVCDRGMKCGTLCGDRVDGKLKQASAASTDHCKLVLDC